MGNQDLTFEVISNTNAASQYTGGCSGSRSECCTRTCTRASDEEQTSSLEAWDKYLEINAGVLQY
ncbi:hypothetical protein CG436_20680 [Pantoea ananatis]|nr:hypothetical protein CG434_21205 [Pantoea ananatis]PQL05270.1 hypothetical protein CG436_20680 [Pantoea ananatis]